MSTSMLDTSLLCLVPYLFGFVVIMIRYYLWEHASSRTSPSFFLVLATMIIPFIFLGFSVLGIVISYGALGFGLLGLVLFGLAILRWFQV